MSIGNLIEQFLYQRLPEAVINGDERQYIEAVVSGYQDRLEDVRSFAKKLDEFWVPGALPDSTTANVILVDLISEQGKAYTRSLDIETATPAAAGTQLNLWASRQLAVPVDDLSNVRYGYDPLRAVDVNTLSWLAATLGTLLYQTDLLTTEADINAAQVELVNTWFPRLKIKGTAQSFEVLGRILGFDDVRVTPLWTRLSPRIPDDVGAPENDPDFAYFPEYFPRQDIGPFYDPFVYRDGPFFSWTGTASNGTNNTSFYTQTITGHNPWIDVVLLGSLAGTNIPAITSGTVTHPAAGSYALAGGASYSKAYVDPVGSSVRFQAIAEGADFNGLYLHVAVSGTYAYITIDDRLSAVKYRSSYFDLGLTADMDKIEDIFGSRAATTNKDLKADPTLTTDGTAVSPYRPWVSGSLSVVETTTDWLTSDGTVATVVDARREADPANPYRDRQLNFDAVVTTGVQVTQAFEEVRAATRLPRRSEAGFLIDDQSCYAPYVSGTLLFTTASGTTSYSGSASSSPLPSYVAEISAIFSTGTLINLVSEINPLNQNEYLYGGTYPAGSYGITGSYDFSTGSYYFATTDLAAVSVFATWTVTTTEVIRPEPLYADKSAGTVTCLGRPEDDDNGLVYELADDYPWRREVVVGGELVELDSYYAGTEIAVQVLEEVTAFNDQTGVDINVFGITSSNTPHPRVVWEPRSTVPGVYRPGYLAVGYDGNLKNLSTLTSNETDFIRPPIGASVGDTETDYDVMFEPGYSLYHVGLAQGVLVADLPKFFGAQHADGLVGWLAFNEHIDDNLTVIDHSFRATPSTLSGLTYASRVWDSERGWHLTMAESQVALDEYRDIVDEITLSFWIKLTDAPTVETRVVDDSLIYFTLKPGGLVSAYAKEADGTVTTVGTGFVGDGQWHFVYLRRDALNAVFGIGVLTSAAAENNVAGVYVTGDPDVDTALYVQAYSGAAYHIHDLRIWNVYKTQAEMDLVRYHEPNPTICTYRLGFIFTLNREDKYGVKVLPSGWAEPDVLPAWYRRTRQALVLRYDSMGSYIGETRFKEVGIGDQRALPDLYVLGQQFVTLVGEGTAPFSTGTGAMPGWNSMWQATNFAGNYDVLPFSGSTSTGIVPVSTPSGTLSPWPNHMAQTNPFRQYVYVNTTTGSAVYQLSLDGSGVPSGGSETWLQAVPVTRKRTPAEVDVDPYLVELVTYGTVYEAFGTGFIQGVLVNGTGTYGFYDPVSLIYYPKVFSGSDLYTSELPTGAYVLLSDGTASLQASIITGLGVAGDYTGTNTTPSLYMYTNSRIAAQVPNPPITIDTAWTGGNNTTQPADNAVDASAMPSILTVDAYGTWLNTPALGKVGVLEFANTGILVSGPYELTVVSGQIGQADTDFDGFSVEINVNDTIIQRRLLRNERGYNFSGTDVFSIDLADGVNGNYLLSFTWTNPAEDTSKGTKRQLAIYGYTLRHITTDLFRVDVLPALTITPLYMDNFSAGTTPGGWYNTINSYGTSVGYAHEASIYTSNDTVISVYPLGDTLTALTNERRNDVIYTGTDVVIADEGSFTFPTFGSLTAVPVYNPPLWMWAGGLTTNPSVTITAKMTYESGAVRVAMSETLDFASPFYSDYLSASTGNAQTPKMTVSGLQPWTTYYYAIDNAGSLFTDFTGTVTTFGTGSHSFSFAVVSNEFNRFGTTATNPAWSYIAAHAPQFLMHAGGLNYDNIEPNDVNLYRTAYYNVLTESAHRDFWSKFAVDYVWAAQDYASGSGVNYQDEFSPSREAARRAYREIVPHYPMAAGNGNNAIYHTFDVGRCRFIVTDCLSERSPSYFEDSGTKTMLGANQLAWFKQQLLVASADADVAATFWVNAFAWTGTGYPVAYPITDFWAAYVTERAEIATFIKTNNIQKVFVLGGEVDCMALDDGRTYDFALDSINPVFNGTGLPVFQSSPMYNYDNTIAKPYLIGPMENTGDFRSQFGLITVTDSGTDVLINFTGYDGFSGTVVNSGGTYMTYTLNGTASPYQP